MVAVFTQTDTQLSECENVHITKKFHVTSTNTYHYECYPELRPVSSFLKL